MDEKTQPEEQMNPTSPGETPENPPARRRRGDPLMLFLMRRGAVFFLLMGFLAVFLYSVGTLRQFTASTQFMLLRMGAFFGIALVLTALLGMVMDMIFLIRNRRFYSLSKFVFVVAACLAGAVLAGSAVFILALAEGNMQ
jgi:hypothetical protein